MKRANKAPQIHLVETGGVSFDQNFGTAKEGSSHGKARFVAVDDGCVEDFYSDADVIRMCETGILARYADHEGRLLPASVIGVDTAINLFMGGAGDVEDPVINVDEARTAATIAPLMATFLGAPTTPGVVDFRSAGMLWALTGYALHREYLYERNPEKDAIQLFEAAQAMESGNARGDNCLTFEPTEGRPRLGQALQSRHAR